MNLLGISQRVDMIEEYKENRDSLDQRWTELIAEIGFLTIPLSNLVSPKDIIANIKLSAIILSGGNTISKIDNSAFDVSIERDLFEEELLKIAIDMNIPIIGICRGMQVINCYFNGTISEHNNHIGIKHKIDFIGEFNRYKSRTVNSYHKWCINESDLSDSLVPIAIAQDKTIECFHHKEYSILGIMWHPEREDLFRIEDINLIRKFLEK